MKRIPCFLLTALMILMCMTFTVEAQEQPLAVAVSDVNGEVGETVTVEVALTSNPGITSLKLSLSYDTTVLTLVESEKTDLFDGWYQTSPTAETLPYLMVWVATDAQNETGTLISLRFRIAESAKLGTVSSPTLTVEEAFCDGAEISADPVSFDISVICRHTYGEYVSVDDSEHKRECSECHEVEQTAHAWDEGVITKPATHLETGTKNVTCTDCGATKEETIPKDPQHTYGAWEPHDETQHKQACACGDVQYGEHVWDDGVITKPATHLETGTKNVTCTVCGAMKEETIPIQNKSEEPPKFWIVPVIIAILAVLIVAGVIVLLLIKRRGRHSPSHRSNTNRTDATGR